MDDERHILLLVLTRPSLAFGVPIEALVLNVTVTVFGGMLLSAPVWYRCPLLFWAAGIPIHMILRRVTAWDYHGFRIIRLWLEILVTGQSALDPIPARPSAKDIPSCG